MPIRYWRIPNGAILVPVPDTKQETDSTCGASSLQAVCLYYGVRPLAERHVARAMRMDVRYGSNPEQIVRGAAAFGLRHQEVQPMSLQRLLEFLNDGKPVIVMLQAWSATRSYRDDWEHGHWVVAIGWDSEGVYFEDPWILGARGYLDFAELEIRWHDIGKFRRHVEHYGVALWKPSATPWACQIHKARHIP